MATFTVSRSAPVAAPTETVRPLVADLRAWQRWSPWEALDADLKRTYSGSDSGVGARYAWAGNRKAGNAWLKWAFSEAAVLSAQKDERIGGLPQRLASKLGKPKALSALAHKLGRAFYHVLHTKEVFDVNRFVRH